MFAHERGRRALFNISLKFWTACPQQALPPQAPQLHRRPTRDVREIFWPVLPGLFRVRIVALEKAVAENLTMREAGSRADIAVRHWRNVETLSGRTPGLNSALR